MRRLSERFASLLPPLAWGLALILFVAVCAELVVRYMTPEPVVALPERLVEPRAAAQKLVDAGPMGVSQGGGKPTVQAAAGTSGLLLVGVATGFGEGPAFALIQQGGDAARPFLIGEKLPSGMELLAIHADRVELGRGGMRETLMLRKYPVNAAVTSMSHTAGYAPAVSASPR